MEIVSRHKVFFIALLIQSLVLNVVIAHQFYATAPPQLQLLTASVYETDCKVCPAKRCVDIKSGSTLHLKCNGSKTLIWTYPQNHYEYSENIMYLASIVDDCEPQGSADFCFTEFKLPNIDYTHTGRYTCIYDHSLYPASENSATIYVFVNDDNHLQVPFEGNPFILISVIQSHPATIPCLPTNSKATVSLLNTRTHTPINVGDNLNVHYSPTIGFHFTNPIWDEPTLICEVKLGNKSQHSPVAIQLSITPSYDLMPLIIVGKSSQLVINGSVSLTCVVHIEFGIHLLMQWSHPVQDASRVSDAAANTEVSGPENGLEIVWKTLIISNLKREDEGYYTCNVSDASGHMFSTNVFIAINDSDTTLNQKFEISSVNDNLKSLRHTLALIITFMSIIVLIIIIVIFLYKRYRRSISSRGNVNVVFTISD